MAKLPSGQVPLDIYTIPKDQGPKENKKTYAYFTDESGKKYYYSANTGLEMQAIADALKKGGYASYIGSQYESSPMDWAQQRYGWAQSAEGSPEEWQTRLQELAKGSSAVDLAGQGYEDITGRLVQNVKGEVNIDRSDSGGDFWAKINAGQKAVSPTNNVEYQKNPTTGQVEPTAYGKPGAVANQAPVQPVQTAQGDIPAQIENTKAQIENLQQQLKVATEAGYGPGGEHEGEQIPGTPNSTTIANEVLTSKNITVDPDKAVTNPTGSWQDIYTDLFTKLGLDKVKDQISDVIAKIQAMDDQMAEEIADANENPWDSEGARQRKVKSIQDKYDMKKAGLNSALTLMQGIYDDGRQETQFLVSTALSQYNADRTFDLNETKMLADQAEAKLTAKKDTQIKEVNGRQLLIDMQTGETIADLGASDVGGGGGTGTTGTTKPPTAGQYQVATYADRIEQAEDIFTKLEPYVAGLNAITLKAQQLLPNALRNENYQLLEQAQRNFINAVLRRESGAAISPSEFDSANKQYFPQPGDGKAVLNQKKANRQTILAGFIRESGPAYTSAQSGGGDNLTDEQAWELYQLTQ